MIGPGRHTNYLLRRLAYLPVSLLLLSGLCFLIANAAPGDPVRARVAVAGSRSGSQDPLSYEISYRRAAASLGYNLPAFYFAVTNAAIPDTLHRIVNVERRRTVKALAQRYGNWPQVQDYYRAVLQLAFYDPAAPAELVAGARKLLVREEADYIARQTGGMQGPAARPLLVAYRKMLAGATPQRLLYPRLYWYGLDNRYHRYLAALLRGEFGESYADRRTVSAKIAVTIPPTLLLNGLALLLVYGISIPLGMYMAYYRGSRFDRWATVLTFLAFGIPGFWVATLLANFLTTPAFGLDWFPSMGFGRIPEGTAFLTALRIRGAHLFLPVLCLTYPSLAYVARHLRSAAIKELRMPYVVTARMKGLPGTRVLWKHVFRNAAFPLVTLLGGLLPALLAGSVLIEQIFNLPGMGQLLYSSAIARDWPVVTALILINGLLTILGLVIADVSYALIDPRVRLGKNTPR